MLPRAVIGKREYRTTGRSVWCAKTPGNIADSR